MSKLEERESRRRQVVGTMIEKPAPTAAAAGVGTVGRGRPKEEGRELKKRISLSVLPSLYEDIQKIAYIERRSVSDIVSELMTKYKEEHEESICKFDTIQNLPQGQ